MICNCSLLNFLINEENFILFFISAGKLEGTEPWGKGLRRIYIACFAIQSHEYQPLYHKTGRLYLAVWEGGGYLGFPIVVEVGREPELVAGEHGADVYRHEGRPALLTASRNRA
jgi:hypothetical protein